MLCAQVVPIVNGFAKDYEGKMTFEVKDAKSVVSKALIEKYGLEVHGMVITDNKDDSLVWSESGHKQKKDVVKAAIDKALGS